MTTAIKDLEDLHTYLSSIMEGRGAARGTLLAIVGGLAWRADPRSFRYNSHPHAVWATIDGRSYVFDCNTKLSHVEIQDRTERRVLHTFDDSTPVSTIWETFSRLGGGPVEHQRSAAAEQPRQRIERQQDVLARLRRLQDQVLDQVGDDAQLANVDLQSALQVQQQAIQLVETIAKLINDTDTAIIRKIGS